MAKEIEYLGFARLEPMETEIVKILKEISVSLKQFFGLKALYTKTVWIRHKENPTGMQKIENDFEIILYSVDSKSKIIEFKFLDSRFYDKKEKRRKDIEKICLNEIYIGSEKIFEFGYSIKFVGYDSEILIKPKTK